MLFRIDCSGIEGGDRVSAMLLLLLIVLYCIFNKAAYISILFLFILLISQPVHLINIIASNDLDFILSIASLH